MKKIFLTLSIVSIMYSCSDNLGKIDKKLLTEKEEPIIGKWQLIEIYQIGKDNNPVWKKVENGEFIEFDIEGEVLFSKTTTDKKRGKYSIDAIRLTLSYINNEVYIENFMFDNGDLILTPTYTNCALGCDKKYKKILNL